MNFFEKINSLELKKDMGLCNLTDEFFCLYLESLRRKNNHSILVVTDSLYDANNLYSNLNSFDDVYLFPMDDFLTSEALAISPDLMINRIETLNSLTCSKNHSIVITNLMGYLRFLPTKEVYYNHLLSLKIGDKIEPSLLVSKLVQIGYSRDTIVNKTGEFGLRGFVVDVFPINEENPVRIEFFDDEIESIRFFDSDTQKSIKKIDIIEIKPVFEFITSHDDISQEEFGKQKYLPFYEDVVNIEKYLDNPITVFKDYEQLEVSFKTIMNDVTTYKSERDKDFDSNYMFELGKITPSYPIYYQSLNNITNKKDSKYYSFDLKGVPNFLEDPKEINNYIRSQISNRKTIVICVPKYQFKSLYKFLNMKVVETDFSNLSIQEVNIVDYSLSKGFIYQNFVFISAFELFHKANSTKKYHTKYKYSSVIHDINKLSVGDYVVHNVHGIGIYNGIKCLSLNGIEKDYLEVLYQGTDKMYIPVEKIEYLSKYSGGEGVVPKINKLGGSEWQKTKNRVKSRISDMADSLIKLYAEREMRKGFAFSRDCDMLLDFEKEFPYELTLDQKRAILQIKEDMEKSTPMDRLLCGDVGFGKTEVAFVAAFKAMLDSKQVLFLCPTTILSKQHYDNAIVRFQNFPVSIGLLNRFTTPKDSKKILDGLKDGTIDMVIGTHRLLSDDVHLKDLGLLIIDEEQRFGVAHKEKIKQYKTNVDVLTLTATPIPRTLQMSLVGIRSLSLINTPPNNRYPVQTYVVEENQQILREAITKELSRNGQIFILYNKVQSIYEYSSRIQKLVPNAKIGVAHGQMNKNQLEDTIYDFVQHEFDVLVCTTIIETGIDIPNVNTLIIIDADHFGLSQLYQIRGRVGRSDKFAYAYLMYQPFKSLTESAVKRLNVIKEFTELGCGFSIATRDLSIRGAGDILGSEQAGFIDSIGIDLYMKILNDEINRRNHNGEDNNLELEEDSKPLIEVATHISDQYVLENDLKIEIHKKINSIVDFDSLKAIKNELEDRFGKLDEDLIVYMYEELFERIAKEIPVSKVHQNKNSIELVFDKEIVSKLDTEQLFVDAFHISNMFRFISRGSHLIIVLDIIKLEKHPIYYLVDLLSKIKLNLSNPID
ncbi:MAG: transcription-repair coupling factor [Bacilli bacterium]|nr:transcription-repair coupling factor [Bacilli bacterium]